jgi:hypothetical protein
MPVLRVIRVETSDNGLKHRYKIVAENNAFVYMVVDRDGDVLDAELADGNPSSMTGVKSGDDLRSIVDDFVRKTYGGRNHAKQYWFTDITKIEF